MNPTVIPAVERPVLYLGRTVWEFDRVIPNGWLLAGDENWNWRCSSGIVIAPVVPTGKNSIIHIWHPGNMNGEEVVFPGLPIAWYPKSGPAWENGTSFAHIVEPVGAERTPLRVSYYEMWHPVKKVQG
jgi:hypothetical protein